MRIIGIDPGTSITGIGVIEQSEKDICLIHCGSVIMDSRDPLPIRLKRIYDECLISIKRYKPHEFAIETAFYGKNIQSTLKLGQARGVAIIAAVNCNLKISEYSPREIKKSVTGNGASSKEQVQFMVKTILSLKERVMQIDSSDAIAVALCHYYCIQNSLFNGGGSREGSSTWKVFAERNPDRIIK
jgi:crossover junction endodeoxyribonuclease RuvC